MKKLTPRQRQGIETKLKITRVATDLFKNVGFHEVTIRDICEAAGISVGSFYHHFESKDEIVNTGHYQIDLLMEEIIQEVELQQSNEDILYVFEQAGKLLQELGWSLSAYSYRHILASKTKYTLRRDRPVFQYVLERVKEAVVQGRLKPETDGVALAEHLMRCSRGVLLDWCLREGDYDLGALMRSDLLLILNHYGG